MDFNNRVELISDLNYDHGLITDVLLIKGNNTDEINVIEQCGKTKRNCFVLFSMSVDENCKHKYFILNVNKDYNDVFRCSNCGKLVTVFGLPLSINDVDGFEGTSWRLKKICKGENCEDYDECTIQCGALGNLLHSPCDPDYVRFRYWNEFQLITSACRDSDQFKKFYKGYKKRVPYYIRKPDVKTVNIDGTSISERTINQVISGMRKDMRRKSNK